MCSIKIFLNMHVTKNNEVGLQFKTHKTCIKYILSDLADLVNFDRKFTAFIQKYILKSALNKSVSFTCEC